MTSPTTADTDTAEPIALRCTSCEAVEVFMRGTNQGDIDWCPNCHAQAPRELDLRS